MLVSPVTGMGFKMRANEFIIEADVGANANDLPGDQVAAIKGAISMLV